MKRNIAILVVMVICFSCGSTADNDQRIEKLDSLYSEVEKEEVNFNTIPSEEVVWRLDTLNHIISDLEDNYKNSINREEALALDKYRSTKYFVKNFKSRYDQAAKEFNRTKTQLKNFSELLRTNPSADKSGNKIDKKYINKNFNSEVRAAEELIAGSKELHKRSLRFIEEHDQKKEVINPVLKSLKRKDVE